LISGHMVLRGNRTELVLYPSLGSTLQLDSLRPFFIDRAGIDIAPSWLLVLTTSCPTCLRLDDELRSLKAAAACHDLRLIPFVIETGAAPDSIDAVLRKHDLSIAALAGPSAFRLLRSRAVPTVLGISSSGTVGFVTYPEAPDWPHDHECAASPLVQPQ
jgi:hypothetical protein